MVAFRTHLSLVKKRRETISLLIEMIDQVLRRLALLMMGTDYRKAI
jgi:hypothetical protein